MDRLNLQKILEEALGSRNVYYQPPENLKLSYPAIIYYKQSISNQHADNLVYKQDDSYSVTVVSASPDIPAVSIISKLPTCRFERFFVSDNLYHYSFAIRY